MDFDTQMIHLQGTRYNRTHLYKHCTLFLVNEFSASKGSAFMSRIS